MLDYKRKEKKRKKKKPLFGLCGKFCLDKKVAIKGAWMVDDCAYHGQQSYGWTLWKVLPW